MKFEELSEEEREYARKLYGKGYLWLVQVEASGKPFGDPIGFKSLDKIGPFLRTLPDHENARTAWSINLAAAFKEESVGEDSPDTMVCHRCRRRFHPEHRPLGRVVHCPDCRRLDALSC